jgi:glyoxylate/hydroxypyruvate reductase A
MEGSTATAILLAPDPWDPAPWAAAIRAADPERPLFIGGASDPEAIAYAVAWKPPHGMLARFPNLKAIFSLGAGADHLLADPTLPDVPLVRIVNPDLTQRMTEWVVLQVLTHHRQQLGYRRQQVSRVWSELPQPAASKVRVGIMGMGALGRDAADALKRLGFDVAGWSRRPASISGVTSFHGQDQLDAFLRRTDILVALLPLTPETRGLLAMPLFLKLARDGKLGGPVLINAGRGGVQVEEDIVAAIETGILIGASLDVFSTEPLDPGSRLWAMENVIVTPHAAAARTAEALIPPILKQIADFEAGKPFENVVERGAGY